ncbi:MAG: imidazolonepropionase [Anaerolineae bacterium]|nr:imidazolonepropionase [Anaerolineae bacterium]
MDADLLIINASELLTLVSRGGPRRGADMDDLGLIPGGAVAVRDGVIVSVGPTEELRRTIRAAQTLDAGGRVVMPGFVDPHTHCVFAGHRADEFEMRLKGASYMEIMAAGGGIMNTVRATRAASVDDLVRESMPRLRRMLAHGTTTAEAKTGYGLTTADEIKMLHAIAALNREQPVELVSTFLGAHAIPAEYKGNVEAFVALVVDEMLPAVAALLDGVRPRFCDVFCEDGAFSLEQSRRILERAKELGLGLKIHVDEFKALGGTALAVQLGAASADHLVATPEDEVRMLAQSDVMAVSLPGTPFGLAHHEYTPARALIDQGGALALATDLNPGTCPCESMQFIIALACRYMRLTSAEAIVAATINAAHAIGMGDRVGSLEAGKQADILILDVPTYRMLAYRFGTNMVATVLKRGEVVLSGRET